MAINHPRTIATVVLTATGLMLAGCSSSSTRATTLDPNPGGSTASSLSATTDATTDAATPLAATTASSAPSATSPTSGTAHPAPGGACSLITENDVTSTVGTDPGKGNEDSSHGATACSYGSYPNPVVTVNVLPTQGKAGYDRFHTDPRLTSGTGAQVVDVAGLGDQAFELTRPHAVAVYFTSADALIVIGYTAPTSPPKGAALTLAKIAAGRL